MDDIDENKLYRDDRGYVRYSNFSIPDLRKRLKKMNQSREEVPGIVEELCVFSCWAVLKNKVLIWTGDERALITVESEKTVWIEIFPDLVHWKSSYYYVSVATVEELKTLREALLKRMVDQEEFSSIYHGTHIVGPTLEDLEQCRTHSEEF
jgi:hypothetical protein